MLHLVRSLLCDSFSMCSRMRTASSNDHRVKAIFFDTRCTEVIRFATHPRSSSQMNSCLILFGRFYFLYRSQLLYRLLNEHFSCVRISAASHIELRRFYTSSSDFMQFSHHRMIRVTVDQCYLNIIVFFQFLCHVLRSRNACITGTDNDNVFFAIANLSLIKIIYDNNYTIVPII